MDLIYTTIPEDVQRDTKPPLPDSIAHLTIKSRERIMKCLDDLRDGGYAMASLCLTAHRQVWMGKDDAAELLAIVLGKNLELTRIADAIKREMNR
jgi:hypothetical protein